MIKSCWEKPSLTGMSQDLKRRTEIRSFKDDISITQMVDFLQLSIWPWPNLSSSHLLTHILPPKDESKSLDPHYSQRMSQNQSSRRGPPHWGFLKSKIHFKLFCLEAQLSSFNPFSHVLYFFWNLKYFLKSSESVILLNNGSSRLQPTHSGNNHLRFQTSDPCDQAVISGASTET